MRVKRVVFRDVIVFLPTLSVVALNTSPTVYQNWEILHSISSLLHLHHAKFALTLPPSVPVPIAVCVFFSNQESFFRRSNYRLLHAQQVLGALAMIDDGELDWKILAISMDDPMASELLGPSKREDFGTWWADVSNRHLFGWVDSFVWGILSKLPFHLFIKKRKCHQSWPETLV